MEWLQILDIEAELNRCDRSTEIFAMRMRQESSPHEASDSTFSANIRSEFECPRYRRANSSRNRLQLNFVQQKAWRTGMEAILRLLSHEIWRMLTNISTDKATRTSVKQQHLKSAINLLSAASRVCNSGRHRGELESHAEFHFYRPHNWWIN